MTNTFIFHSAAEFPLVTLSTAFALAFEGYFVPVADDPTALAARIRTEQIDLAASFVVEAEGEIAGLCLMARRGHQCRVAGMGVAPAWRGRGVSGAIMQHLLDEARSRGERDVLLEVIEGNAPAVRLYEKSGFVKTRRLVGYTAESLPAHPDPLTEITSSEFALAVGPDALDAPWQVHPATLMALTAPTRAFRLGAAMAVVSILPEAGHLRALYVSESSRRNGEARKLLYALAATFPGRRWSVPPLWPEEQTSTFMQQSGFVSSELAQWEMRCLLQQ